MSGAAAKRQGTRTLEISVPGPLGEGLGLNARVHWAIRSGVTKETRRTWKLATQMTHGWVGPFGMVRVTYHAKFCRKKPRTGRDVLYAAGYRPRDKDNLSAAMKPALDGLVDAGLVADDDAEHVKFGDHEIRWVDTFDEECVTVQVEEL